MTDLKSLSRQRYTPEFKLRLVRMALKTLEENGSVAALACEHNDNLLFKWIRLWTNEGRIARPRGRKAKPAPLPALVPVQIVHPLPASLPRDENRLKPAGSCCPDCGGALSYLGEDAAEQLELMRSAFRVIRTVREKHACRKCDRIVQAPAPSRPIERSIAGPGLLARVLTSKYAEHTPLNRQSEIYERQGVTLSRSLLSGWVDACCQLLSPLDEPASGVKARRNGSLSGRKKRCRC